MLAIQLLFFKNLITKIELTLNVWLSVIGQHEAFEWFVHNEKQTKKIHFKTTSAHYTEIFITWNFILIDNIIMQGKFWSSNYKIQGHEMLEKAVS